MAANSNDTSKFIRRTLTCRCKAFEVTTTDYSRQGELDRQLAKHQESCKG